VLRLVTLSPMFHTVVLPDARTAHMCASAVPVAGPPNAVLAGSAGEGRSPIGVARHPVALQGPVHTLGQCLWRSPLDGKKVRRRSPHIHLTCKVSLANLAGNKQSSVSGRGEIRVMHFAEHATVRIGRDGAKVITQWLGMEGDLMLLITTRLHTTI